MTGTWLVDGAESQRVPVMVDHAVVTPGAAGGVPLQILNPTDQAAMVHKGKTMAMMEAVTVGAVRD